MEEIGEPMAEFVIVYTENINDNTLALNLLEELLTSLFNSDSLHESVGIKNSSVFLNRISLRIPTQIFSALSKFLGLLDCESYQLRMTFVNVMTNFITELLTRSIQEIENVELRTNYKKTKDKLLRILLRRVYDKTSFVRKEVLNSFKLMIVKNVIDDSFYEDLMFIALGRLKDQTINVRKVSMSLLEEIIKIKAIFYEVNEKKNEGFITRKTIKEEIKNLHGVLGDINASLEKVKERIKALRIEMVNRHPDLQKDEINEKLKVDDEFLELKGEYDKALSKKTDQEDFIEFYKGYDKLITSLESCIPILTQLLGSPNSSDIIESIKLLTYLQRMKVGKAVDGTRKILVLFFNKDEAVKNEALEAYKTLYLQDQISLEQRAFALIELLKDADSSEET